MSFFNKQNNEDSGEQWRKKYLDLFDEQNKIEYTQQEKEKVLRQFIIQLSILHEGLDKYLDPILTHVRNHVKNELELEPIALKSELKMFTESIKNMPQKKKTLKADLLFDFLVKQRMDPSQKNALRELQKSLGNDESTIEQSTDLFIEILKITEPELLPTERVESEDEEIIYIDVNIVCEQILEYLSILGIPEVFGGEVDLIKETLSSPQKSAADFEKILIELVSILLRIKEFSEVEQKDIDQFLFHVATKLSELNTIVTQTNLLAATSAKNRNKLDQSVFTQIRDLQTQAVKMESLDSLKENINQCFKVITSDIKTNYQNEKEAQSQFQNNMAELINKIIKIELESESLKMELKVVHTQSMNDTLTGLPNRNAYNVRFKEEIARYKRFQLPLTLAILDVDHFKKVNDTYGHQSGDKVLILLVKQLESNIRDTDFIARFSGEKFVILLSNTDKNSALFLVDQWREVIAKTECNMNGTVVPITISSGLTEFIENDTEETTFERADKALHEAKNKGRNLCSVL
jgi:diguanylate cyclase